MSFKSWMAERKVNAEKERQLAKIRKEKAMGVYYKEREKAAIAHMKKEGSEYYNKPHGFSAFLGGVAKKVVSASQPARTKSVYRTTYVKKGKHYIKRRTLFSRRQPITKPTQAPTSVFGKLEIPSLY